MSAALALRNEAFEPTNVSEALKLSQILVASRLLPKSVGTPEAAFAIILAGRELGLSPMKALRSIHIIEGKPTMSADLMLALVLGSPKCKRFQLLESTPAVATYETEREGGVVTRMSFTMDEAKAAGLTGKDNWRKYPSAMLRARCIAALARAVFPDVVLGVYESDELEAGPRPRVVEAAPVRAHDADGVVVEAPRPTPRDALTDEGLAGTYAERYAAAPTEAEVDVIAEHAKAAYFDGKLSKQDMRDLKVCQNEARTRLIARAVEVAKPVETPAPARPAYGTAEWREQSES